MSGLTDALKKPFVLMVSLPSNSPDLAAAAWNGGADLIKVHANVAHFASGTHYGTFEEESDTFQKILSNAAGPVGLVPGGADAVCTRAEMQRAREMGFDFWDIFWHHAPLWLFSLPDWGRMMAVDATFTPTAVAHVSSKVDLIEGSVIPQTGYRAPLRAHDLGTYHTLCSSSVRPVAIPTQRAVDPAELSHLQAAGARGVVIGAIVTGHDAAGLELATRAFRQAIDRL